jgi:hypothetical protein
MKMSRGLTSVIDQLDPPWCAVCQKPVERIERMISLTARTMVFVVRCHGQIERAELPEEIAVLGRFHGFGEAFKMPSLPALSIPKQISHQESSTTQQPVGASCARPDTTPKVAAMAQQGLHVARADDETQPHSPGATVIE